MKRIIDFNSSILLLLLLSPVLCLVYILIRLKLGTPVIFKQQRPGLNEKPFNIYKFRTMTNQRDKYGILLPDEVRLTKFGRWIRRLSLDELPQLFNVLKGELSLVGPRPLLMEYLPRYTYEQRRRHEVLPGITGWAQVNGRNAISWEEKFELDVWYIDNFTLILDIKILILTFKKVFKSEGINQIGHATIPEFKGSEVERL